MKNNLDDIIEETMDAGGSLFGGAAYGGSGTFSYAQQAGAKTWAPAVGGSKNRSTTADPQGFNIKDIADDEHENHHKAPLKRPFPLDTVNDFLAQAYVQLCSAEIQLKTCKKYNAVLTSNKAKKALIEHLHKKTKALKIMIKNMSADLDRLSFS